MVQGVTVTLQSSMAVAISSNLLVNLILGGSLD